MKHFIRTTETAKEVFRIYEPEKCADLYRAALKIPNFWTWPASSNGHQHFEGGLAIHTAQVLVGAVALLDSVGTSYRKDETKIACVWHDAAKVLDYEKNTSGEWVKTDHAHKIRHLAKSAMWFREEALRQKNNIDIDFVLHLMLAHHGHKEYGSPIEPQCAEAWAIHVSDSLSAWHIED